MAKDISHDSLTEMKHLLESDLETLLKLIVTHRRPVDEGSVRAASAILRRWLIEGLMGKLCRALRVRASFPVLDNGEVIRALPFVSDVAYFMTGGVRFNGAEVSGNYVSELPYTGKPRLPVERMHYRFMKLGEFTSQKRLFHAGNYFSCEEIIKFVANKLGGVHLDESRKGLYEKMEEAARAFTFGGPKSNIKRGTPGAEHLVIEPDAVEVLHGFHVEIIAAGASLLCVHLDGIRLMPLKIERRFLSRIDDYLGIQRQKWLKSARLE